MVEIKNSWDGEICIINVIGEVDASSSIHLDQSINEAIKKYEKILVNCQELEYISSAGLGVFMSYINDIEERQIKMVLFGLSEKVKHVFQILGLDQIIEDHGIRGGGKGGGEWNIRSKYHVGKSGCVEIRGFLNNVLAQHHIPDFEMNTLVLAVDEVCANLIIHTHGCNPKENIELKVDVRDGSEVVFEITDNGTGFNIVDYEEPSLLDIVKQKRKGGMGLMLVKRIMDEIELVKGKKKNTYRLYKRF